ncbi:MAG: hypothetical protein KIT84_08175 [Labilithrix sp.]|nr:hypothetical protein [Labilithrix sp.]MCW5810973.1 hypothetical protein [Labilithrix sp.]
MNARRLVLLIAGTTLFAVTAYACGGQIDPDPDPDPTGSGVSRSQRGENDDIERKDDSPPPASSCVLRGGSSSGTSDFPQSYCESVSLYQCGAETRALSCKCAAKKGTCSCNGESFAIDCNGACAPSGDVYARCNLPPP